MIWIMVVSPMDQVFVGPFADHTHANRWIGRQTHDFYKMTTEEMQRNIREFGEIPVQNPASESKPLTTEQVKAMFDAMDISRESKP